MVIITKGTRTKLIICPINLTYKWPYLEPLKELMPRFTFEPFEKATTLSDANKVKHRKLIFILKFSNYSAKLWFFVEFQQSN